MESLLILILILLSLFFAAKSLRKKGKSWYGIIVFFLYIFSLLVFAFGLLPHSHQYTEAVDPIDGDCYTPFGDKHIYSLMFYFVIYHISVWMVWIRGRKMPPLLLVLFLIFIIIGIAINGANLCQFSYHNVWSENDSYTQEDGAGILFAPATIFALIIGVAMLFKIIFEERTLAVGRHFRNAFLEKCNRFISQKYSPLSWAFIFLVPAFIVVTLILILFGQDYDSLVRVYTETTSWAFSQKSHPPPLDHNGHYLCTVSARGNPRIVKPILIGKRHGQPIIVNRQLQIANAFEEIIADFSPKLHRFIQEL